MAPKIGTKLRTEFIIGMEAQDDRCIILHIDKVFSAEVLVSVDPIGSEARPKP